MTTPLCVMANGWEVSPFVVLAIGWAVGTAVAWFCAFMLWKLPAVKSRRADP